MAGESETDRAGIAVFRDGHRFLKFVVVGLSNTLVSFLVFLLMLAILPAGPGAPGIAQAASYSAGIVWSYGWNRKWVFAREGKIGAEFLRFLLSQIVLMLLSIGGVSFMVGVLELHPIVGWVTVMAAITFLNFAVLSLWAFSNK